MIKDNFNNNLFPPLDKNKCREELGIDKDKKVLISVGNFEEVKGHKYLIEGVNILKKKYPDIGCYIIGGGSLMSSLNEQIKILNLKENIFLIGRIQHKEISKWMNASNLFVLPSLSESFGIVQIEAFACGKPVVATKNEASKEVVISEDYGYLCNIADPKDLAKKIDEALKKDWDREKILDYSKKFSQESINKKMLNLYGDILIQKND
jgi:glycosyltransferase involved in cell wall biosynthesis